MARLKIGSPLVAVGSGRVSHSLDDRVVIDGEIIEVLTDVDWISGHYRPVLHPDSGAVKFDLHVAYAEGGYEHVAIFLPENSLFRRPTYQTTPEGNHQ